MDARRMRVEFIRFSLLITLTLALVSVAVRHSGSHHGTTQASHYSSPSASTSPRAGTSVSGGGAAAGQGSGTSSQGTGSQSTGTGNSGSGTGAGGSTGAQVVPMLPRTGAAQVTELAGLAALFIAAGAFSMTVSRRSVR